MHTHRSRGPGLCMLAHDNDDDDDEEANDIANWNTQPKNYFNFSHLDLRRIIGNQAKIDKMNHFHSLCMHIFRCSSLHNQNNRIARNKWWLNHSLNKFDSNGIIQMKITLIWSLTGWRRQSGWCFNVFICVHILHMLAIQFLDTSKIYSTSKTREECERIFCSVN